MADKIIQQCVRERLPLPQAIANAPTLFLGLELYADAFWELNTCRPATYSLGSIPWTAIREYAQCWEFSEDQTEDLFYFVRVQDQEYLKHHAPKKKSSTKCQSPRVSNSSHSGWPSGRKK